LRRRWRRIERRLISARAASREQRSRRGPGENATVTTEREEQAVKK
jgi:hypothetical protein